MKLHLISLKLTRYNDRQNILTAYSRELGRVSLTVPASGGRSGARVRALTMPLRLVECEATPRPGRELMPLGHAAPIMALPGVYGHPVKQMLAMFLGEVLATVLREGGADAAIWDFAASSVGVLDSLDGPAAANFHICFLLQLGRLLGIEPDAATWAPGRVLDLRDGVWRVSMPLHGLVLDTQASAHAATLMRMDYANMHSFRYTRSQRAKVLDGVLDYYSRHVTPMGSLHSLAVLRSL